MNCGNCRFFHSCGFDEKKVRHGECHRYPPTVTQAVESSQFSSEYALSDVSSRPVSHFPEVTEEEWCGEWQKAGLGGGLPETRSYGTRPAKVP